MKERQIHRVVQLIDLELHDVLSIESRRTYVFLRTSSIHILGVKIDESNASTIARMLSFVETLLLVVGRAFLAFCRRGVYKYVRVTSFYGLGTPIDRER
jgi:hypothetical protein